MRTRSGFDTLGRDTTHPASSTEWDTASGAAAPRRDRCAELIAGKYRLSRKLGEGGMSTVWVAQNIALEIPVAIKFIRAELGAEGAERLLLEARMAARVRHPAIVSVYDFGKTEGNGADEASARREGHPFIVMELLEGRTLAQVLDQDGALDPIAAVRTLLPIADALALAHRHGIVHRDLKPENLFLSKTEGQLQPKLLDFGIARKVCDERAGRLTRGGAVLGSPHYMSPEQARGDAEVDHRTDVWAFCVVLFETLTNDLPFSGRNYNAVMQSIIDDDPQPLAELAAGGGELWSIIERGLRKDPARRWQSMPALGGALSRWLLSRGVSSDLSGTSVEARWLGPGTAPVSRTPRSLPAPSEGSIPRWSADNPVSTCSTRRRPFAGFAAAAAAVAAAVCSATLHQDEGPPPELETAGEVALAGGVEASHATYEAARQAASSRLLDAALADAARDAGAADGRLPLDGGSPTLTPAWAATPRPAGKPAAARDASSSHGSESRDRAGAVPDAARGLDFANPY